MAFKKQIIPVVFTAGICLSACSGQNTTDSHATKALQATTDYPLATNATGLENISGFDLYLDGQTLYAAFTAANNDAKHPVIAYLSSANGGVTWSKPIDIGKPFNLTVESKAGNDIQIAASGKNILLILQASGELPGMGSLVSLYSQDGGNTWQKGLNPTGSDTDQSHPDLAADQQSQFHLVWLDDRDENGYQGLRYARTSDAGQHWEAQQTIDESSCSCCWNRLLIAKSGSIFALYRDMEPRDMALAQSSDAGLTWKQISKVGDFNWKFEGCPHNGGGLSEAGSGDLHALVWTGAEKKTGLYHLHSVDGGKNWTAPQALGAETAAFHGDIAALDAKRIVAVWDAMSANGSTVFMADSNDNGASWSAPRSISATDASASFPRVVATGSGWLAAWLEQKPHMPKQWVSAVIQ